MHTWRLIFSRTRTKDTGEQKWSNTSSGEREGTVLTEIALTSQEEGSRRETRGSRPRPRGGSRTWHQTAAGVAYHRSRSPRGKLRSRSAFLPLRAAAFCQHRRNKDSIERDFRRFSDAFVPQYSHNLVGVWNGHDEVATGSQGLARVAQHHVRLRVRLEGVVQRELTRREIETLIRVSVQTRQLLL